MLYHIMQTSCKGSSKENGLDIKYLREALKIFSYRNDPLQKCEGRLEVSILFTHYATLPNSNTPKAIPDVFFIFQ